jgi:hypothetical protein
VQIEDIELKYKYGAYIPNNDFFNCDPFPIEWLEILDKGMLLKL